MIAGGIVFHAFYIEVIFYLPRPAIHYILINLVLWVLVSDNCLLLTLFD